MKILIIQLRQLGDVLLSTPLAQNIKIFYPDSSVYFLTSSQAEDIVFENLFIDKVLTLKKGVKHEVEMIYRVRKEGFDAILDVQRTARSKRITLFSKAKIKAAFYKKGNNFPYNTLIKQETKGYTAFERLDLLKAIGIDKPEKLLPSLFFDSSTEERVKNYLINHNIKNYFVISPTARKQWKMWSLEEFGKLADKISKKLNLTAVITYGNREEKEKAKETAEQISNSHIIEKPFSIKEFAALLKLSKFSVGNDSFPSHVAVSQGVKTVVICGPTSGWYPEHKNVLLIYKGLDCQPCNNPEKCPFNLACYRELSHEEVLPRVLKFVSEQ